MTNKPPAARKDAVRAAIAEGLRLRTKAQQGQCGTRGCQNRVYSPSKWCADHRELEEVQERKHSPRPPAVPDPAREGRLTANAISRRMAAREKSAREDALITAAPLDLHAGPSYDDVDTTVMTESCTPWDGPPRRHQVRAQEVLVAAGRDLTHLAWVTPVCGTAICVNPDHLVTNQPLRLAYPHGVCIYCGRSAGTRDHLLPRRWTGDALRKYVATVPACGTCNSVLSDTLTWSITERRALAHHRLARKYRTVLLTLDKTDEELDEYGPTLRAHLIDGMAKKREVLRMLAWPEDPAYDRRALERSGIQDPYAVGLLI